MQNLELHKHAETAQNQTEIALAIVDSPRVYIMQSDALKMHLAQLSLRIQLALGQRVYDLNGFVELWTLFLPLFQEHYSHLTLKMISHAVDLSLLGELDGFAWVTFKQQDFFAMLNVYRKTKFHTIMGAYYESQKPKEIELSADQKLELVKNAVNSIYQNYIQNGKIDVSKALFERLEKDKFISLTLEEKEVIFSRNQKIYIEMCHRKSHREKTIADLQNIDAQYMCYTECITSFFDKHFNEGNLIIYEIV